MASEADCWDPTLTSAPPPAQIDQELGASFPCTSQLCGQTDFPEVGQERGALRAQAFMPQCLSAARWSGRARGAHIVRMVTNVAPSER